MRNLDSNVRGADAAPRRDTRAESIPRVSAGLAALAVISGCGDISAGRYQAGDYIDDNAGSPRSGVISGHESPDILHAEGIDGVTNPSGVVRVPVRNPEDTIVADGGDADSGEQSHLDGGSAGDGGDGGTETPDGGHLIPSCDENSDCSDSLFCDGSERCTGEGECVESANPPVVNDNVACTIDLCDEENDRVMHTADNEACGDRNPCTEDVCDTTEGCQNPPDAAQEGNECTTPAGRNGECEDGTCVARCNEDNECDDNASCTTDFCDDTAGVCRNVADNDFCRAQPGINFCDGDNQRCRPGHESADAETGCIPSDREPVCIDDDNCTTDRCNPSANGGIGACENTAIDCSDFDGQCFTGECDPESGECESNPLPLIGTPCEDGRSCVLNTVCQPDGDCAGGAPKDCSHLSSDCLEGTCNEGLAGRCVAIAANEDADCEDGNLCTTNTACRDGACTDGEAVNCTDVLFCTINERCEPAIGCAVDERDCSGSGSECHVGVCDEGANTCEAEITVGEACESTEACRINAICQEDGTCGGGEINTRETLGNLVDDNCDGYIDLDNEHAVANVLCQGLGTSVTPAGASRHDCTGMEFVQIIAGAGSVSSATMPVDMNGFSRLEMYTGPGASLAARVRVEGRVIGDGSCPQLPPGVGPDCYVDRLGTPRPGFQTFTITR
ncbi:MAG: hypothetical protein AAB592_04570 [Patescibacteria group bacterium]